jgi:hypothetical protein
MKINPAPLHVVQAVLIGLCFCLSVAILGTAGHTLHVFKTQQSSNPWWLPLWPQHFDASGISALIGSAAVVTVLSAIFLVFALVPRVRLALPLIAFVLTMSVQSCGSIYLPRYSRSGNRPTRKLSDFVHCHLRLHSQQQLPRP